MIERIFLSYRRNDTAAYAGRIFDRLSAHFGEMAVFFDVESINAGADFVDRIEQEINSKAVLLVVIGRKWLTFRRGGRRAIAQRDDFVRREIRLALDAGAEMIPVLVAGVTMPAAEDLPPDIRPFAKRHAVEIRHAQFNSDVQALIRAIERLFHEGEEAKAPARSSEPRVADLGDVSSWGWTVEMLVTRLIELDYETIDDLTAPHAGTVAQWTPVLKEHPDTWRLLVTGPGSIVGNWQFVALFEEDHRRAVAGQLFESDITVDRVQLIELPGWYDVYFVAMFMLTPYRHAHHVAMLFTSLLDHMTYLARNGVFFNDVCVNAYSPAAHALCKTLHFERTAEHIDHGTIYRRVLYPFPKHRLFDERTELRQLYEKGARERE